MLGGAASGASPTFAHPALERDPRSAHAVLEPARFVLEHDEHAGARRRNSAWLKPSRPNNMLFRRLQSSSCAALSSFAGDARHLLDVIALQPGECGSRAVTSTLVAVFPGPWRRRDRPRAARSAPASASRWLRTRELHAGRRWRRTGFASRPEAQGVGVFDGQRGDADLGASPRANWAGARPPSHAPQQWPRRTRPSAASASMAKPLRFSVSDSDGRARRRPRPSGAADCGTRRETPCREQAFLRRRLRSSPSGPTAWISGDNFKYYARNGRSQRLEWRIIPIYGAFEKTAAPRPPPSRPRAGRTIARRGMLRIPASFRAPLVSGGVRLDEAVPRILLAPLVEGDEGLATSG